LQQLVVRYRIEIRLEVRIDDVATTEVEPLVGFPQRLLGVLVWPKAIREIFEVRLEDWFENELRCCLNYTIGDDGDSERSSLRSLCQALAQMAAPYVFASRNTVQIEIKPALVLEKMRRYIGDKLVVETSNPEFKARTLSKRKQRR